MMPQNSCNALSQKEGLEECYTFVVDPNATIKSYIVCNWDANGYRLPTEAEWEYACKPELLRISIMEILFPVKL